MNDPMTFSPYIKSFVGLLAIVNPMGAIPIFLSLTENNTKEQLKTITLYTSMAVFGILSTSLFAGQFVMEIMGITISSFRVGGGILILLMAIHMLQGETSSVKLKRDESDEASLSESVGISVVPLGMPLLSGPGSISTVILYGSANPSWEHYFILVGIIFCVSAVCFFSLKLATLFSYFLGKTGINIITRFMGLIMAAIGVEFIAGGLKVLLPGLAGS